MISYFTETIQSVANLSILKKSTNLFQIAIQMIKLIKEESSKQVKEQDCESSSETSVPKLEEIFVEAYKIVTDEKVEEIKNKIDYKLVNTTLEASRILLQNSIFLFKTCKKTLYNGQKSTRSTIYQILQFFNQKKGQLFELGYKMKNGIKSKAEDKKNIIRNSLTSARFFLKKEANDIRNSRQINEMSLKIGDNIRFVKNLAKLSSMMSKRILANFFQKMKNKFIKNKLIVTANNALCLSSKKVRNSAKFLNKTATQNKQSIGKIIFGSMDFFVFIAKTNKKYVKFAMKENIRKITRHAKRVELEVFYSPEESVRIKEFIGVLYRSIFPETRSIKFPQKDRKNNLEFMLDNNSECEFLSN